MKDGKKTAKRLQKDYLYNTIQVEFEAVMVLPEITQNYDNYCYGNYVGNAPRL